MNNEVFTALTETKQYFKAQQKTDKELLLWRGTAMLHFLICWFVKAAVGR